jgi:uncharacterized protein (DUF2062 family)
LLRDPGRPGRTASAFGLGAAIGATPVLGVHTWLAAAVAALLRLPAGTSVLGSNLSNPLTFLPITLLEIRVGSWLLGRELPPLDQITGFDDLLPYLGAAWVGTGPVAAAMAGLGGGILYLVIRRNRGVGHRARVAATDTAGSTQRRGEKGSTSE